MKIILEIFSRLRAWFANIDIKNVNICGRTYKTELYIVAGALESFYRSGDDMAVRVRPIKRMIHRKMKNMGLDGKFDRFLIEKGIMEKNKKKGGE